MLRVFLRLAVYVPVDEASAGSGLAVASATAVQEILRVFRYVALASTLFAR
jgi:hypothetical protein